VKAKTPHQVEVGTPGAQALARVITVNEARKLLEITKISGMFASSEADYL
jgi:hypothetical protein